MNDESTVHEVAPQMQVGMKRSEQINELVAALCKAQAEFEPVLKETENPFFKSKYADLATVISATRPALNRNGLVIIQGVRCDAERSLTEIETLLAHTSGQWISDTLQMPAAMKDRMDAQTVGSSQTYGRRYAWQAMIGVAADVDDDGNAATGRGTKEAAQTVAKEKLAPVKKEVTVQYSKENMFVTGPGMALIGNVLRASGAFNQAWNVWTCSGADAMNILKACEEQGIEVIVGEMPGSPEVVKAPVDGNLITEGQAKRLFAISREAGWATPELKIALKKYLGVEHTKEIPKARYEEIVRIIQAGTGHE